MEVEPEKESGVIKRIIMRNREAKERRGEKKRRQRDRR